MTSADRVALVTGAARGQGAAIVKRLHADGFRVAACDLLVDELKTSVDGLGDGVLDLELDVHRRNIGTVRCGRPSTDSDH